MMKMSLSCLEAFGYEFGTILRSSTCLFIGQIIYVCFISFFISLPGSHTVWLFCMHLVAAIISGAYDLNFFQGALPTPLPQHVRTCLDMAVFYTTSDFLLVGDNVVDSEKARKIAQGFINKMGYTASTLFFIPAIFLANCAFIAAVRLLINLVVTLISMLREVMGYFLGPQSSSSTSMSNSNSATGNNTRLLTM